MADEHATERALETAARAIPADDDSCGWWRLLPEPDPPRRFEGKARADCVIVGAGFTGLAAARRLAELRPSWRIVLLDAQRVGYSSSGRNSGFIGDIAHLDPTVTDGEAQRQKLVARAGVDALRTLVRDHKIECQWSEIGRLHVAVEDRALKNLEHLVQLLERFDERHTRLEGDGISKILGTDYYARGVHIAGTVLVQPSALARGIAGALPANVELYEDSPVTALTSGECPEVSTRSGLIRADRVAFCLNGSIGAFGLLRSRVLPLWTYASLTAPLSTSQQEALGGDREWGVVSEDRMGTSMRRTQDQRFLIRNSVRYDGRVVASPESLPRYRERHRASLLARYPALEDLHIESTWGGLLGMTLNQGQYWGKLGTNIYATAGYNGTGVAKGTGSGIALAEEIVGQSSALVSAMESMVPPSWAPPPPFIGLGVRAMTSFLQRRAGRER